MTTREPGAIEVLTHGLAFRPFSVALRASTAAAIITEGLEVLVHEVIEAIDTAPWSSSNSRPSGMDTGTGFSTRSRSCSAVVERGSCSGSCSSEASCEGASEAGKDSTTLASTSTFSSRTT